MVPLSKCMCLHFSFRTECYYFLALFFWTCFFWGLHSLQSSNLQRVLEDYFLALFLWRCFLLGFPFYSELKFAMGTWRAYENPWKWKLTNIRHGIGTLRLTLHKGRFFACVDHASTLLLWIFTDACCSLTSQLGIFCLHRRICANIRIAQRQQFCSIYGLQFCNWHTSFFYCGWLCCNWHVLISFSCLLALMWDDFLLIDTYGITDQSLCP